jgi:hypothetical protein
MAARVSVDAQFVELLNDASPRVFWAPPCKYTPSLDLKHIEVRTTGTDLEYLEISYALEAANTFLLQG